MAKKAKSKKLELNLYTKIAIAIIVLLAIVVVMTGTPQVAKFLGPSLEKKPGATLIKTGVINQSLNYSACSDTDGGYNLAVKGTCFDGTRNMTDYCISDTALIETYCARVYNNTMCVSVNTTCPAGQICFGGRCRSDIV
jgi:hypothetical protein